MITLKLNAYTPKEVKLLNEIIANAIDTAIDRECETDCRTCDVRHLCYDLNQCEQFTSQSLEEIVNASNGT